MSDCCRALADQFDGRRVEREVARYRERGAEPTTLALARALRRAGARGRLLDVGGGIGVLSAELLDGEVESAVNVEISPAYLEASRTLAAEAGYAGRMEHRLGDFVELAEEVGEADAVALDRAICCYPEMEPLVRRSAARARHLYGFVVPRDRPAVRAVIGLQNLGRRLLGRAFRVYVHRLPSIDRVLGAAGFELRSAERTFVWEVRVYERRTAT